MVDGTTSGRGGKQYTIYKFREPTLPTILDGKKGGQDIIEVFKKDVEILRYTFPEHGNGTIFANTEAMFIDSNGYNKGEFKGDIYMVTKWHKENNAKIRLFRLQAGPNGVYQKTLQEMSNSRFIKDAVWTGADMTRDGLTVALRSTEFTFFWTRTPTIPIRNMFDRLPCGSVKSGSKGQYEAVSFTPNGASMIEIAEKSKGWAFEYSQVQPEVSLLPDSRTKSPMMSKGRRRRRKRRK